MISPKVGKVRIGCGSDSLEFGLVVVALPVAGEVKSYKSAVSILVVPPSFFF